MPDESAEVDEAVALTPLVADGVSKEVVAADEPAPAPAEEPAVAAGVTATVPEVDPWT